MPHFAAPVRSPADRRQTAPSAAPQPRRTGPQRSVLWHVLQLKAAREAAPAEPSRSGLPARLKSGVEKLSGLAMDDVRVHRNSSEPAALGALAFTQGSDIHLGPGQERHLAHEAWHVVQQKQGRVQATTQLKGVALNEDSGLEREADAMGAEALAAQEETPMTETGPGRGSAPPAQAVVQRMSVKGDFVAAGITDAAKAKHVVAADNQEAAAKANEGSTTFVTSADLLTNKVDLHNHNFPLTKSSYKKIQKYVKVTVYAKSVATEQGAGKNVTRTVNDESKVCEIGVKKPRTNLLWVDHFKMV